MTQDAAVVAVLLGAVALLMARSLWREWRRRHG
jgi:hypothetical protein